MEFICGRFSTALTDVSLSFWGDLFQAHTVEVSAARGQLVDFLVWGSLKSVRGANFPLPP